MKNTISVDLTLEQINDLTDILCGKLVSLVKEREAFEDLAARLEQNAGNPDYVPDWDSFVRRHSFDKIGENIRRYCVDEIGMSNDEMLNHARGCAESIEQHRIAVSDTFHLLVAKQDELCKVKGINPIDAMLYGDSEEVVK